MLLVDHFPTVEQEVQVYNTRLPPLSPDPAHVLLDGQELPQQVVCGEFDGYGRDSVDIPFLVLTPTGSVQYQSECPVNLHPGVF
jgi:hypothetical protein